MIGFTGVILAGGQSRRMGQAKSNLPFGNTNFLDQAKQTLARAGATEILICDNSAHLKDEHPDSGPLGGIYTALQHTINDCLIIPVDMPLLSPKFINTIMTLNEETLAVHYRKHPLPLYLKNCTKVKTYLKHTLESTSKENKKRLSLYNFLASIEATQLETKDTRCLTNINTPEEYQELQEK